MAKLVWVPGDEVGGPQQAYFTLDGKPTEPIMLQPGRRMRYRDGAGNLYRQEELVLTVTAPEKKLPTPGRKKVR